MAEELLDIIGSGNGLVPVGSHSSAIFVDKLQWNLDQSAKLPI